jgi:hypothetical protein
MTRGTLVLLAVITAVFAVLLIRPAGQSAPRRIVRGIVPVESTLEPLAQPTRGGNTVLRVRYADGVRLPVRIPYATEYGTVVLADDGQGFDARAGDGLYTALGTMDVAATRARLFELSRSDTAMPTRAWRDRSKTSLDARIDPGRFRVGERFTFEPWGNPALISSSHSLLIRHLGVVEDASRTSAACGQPSMGVWSFGHLMEQMANTPVTGVTGSQFVRDWLDRWMVAQPVNGFSVSPRTMMQAEILDPWIAASGGPGAPLDLSIAPFRLLAIVNRLDLREQVAYGGTSGGELRFVFMYTPPGCVSTGQPFEVILEYGLPASGCLNLKALAAQWKALDALGIGSAAYNAALEAITQQVVVAGAGIGKPNGSALNQVRTNENLLDNTGDGLDWQVREFRIDPVTHLLTQDTVAQTPDKFLRFTPKVANYVNGHAASIKAGTNVVPLTYPTAANPFRGGGLVYGLGNFWNDTGGVPIPDREARHKFSLNTCDGCHTGETHNLFTHVGAAPFGTQASLSEFMTGTWVDDPADHTPLRFFDELDRRAVDLDALLNTACFVVPLDLPLLAISH